jgi:hypothetical protein
LQSYLEYGSGDNVQVQFVDELELDAFPPWVGVPSYTPETWVADFEAEPQSLDFTHLFDYEAMFEEVEDSQGRSIIDLVNDDVIDEVWLWHDPTGRSWEAAMVGPLPIPQGPYLLNQPAPIAAPGATKAFVVMGLDYSRHSDLAAHSFGHRIERIMRRVFGPSPPEPTPWASNTWDHFSSLDADHPASGSVGTVHHAFNGIPRSPDRNDNDHMNLSGRTTDERDWANYPDLQGWYDINRNCTLWDCRGGRYYVWWMQHLPKFSGMNPEYWNNWWPEIALPVCYFAE